MSDIIIREKVNRLSQRWCGGMHYVPTAAYAAKLHIFYTLSIKICN